MCPNSTIGMRFFIIFTWLMLLALPIKAQDSQTAFNFLRLPTSAHAAALGGENVTLTDNDAAMVFHNPALLNFVSDDVSSTMVK